MAYLLVISLFLNILLMWALVVSISANSQLKEDIKKAHAILSVHVPKKKEPKKAEPAPKKFRWKYYD